jgi:signal transduction histidine kinase
MDAETTSGEAGRGATEDQSEMHKARLILLGEMTAAIAHDMKNPISVIDIFSQLLSAELEKDGHLTPAVAEKINRIEVARKKLNKLVQLVNRFSRSDDEMFPGNEIVQVIENTAMLVDHRLKSAMVNLETAIDKTVKVFFGCPSQVEQVLVNLVNNAVDALEGQAGKRTVRLTVKFKDQDSTKICVTVEDNGPGIPAELQAKVFNAFFTTKSADKGTGLGLHICRQIVASHGSVLQVSSEKGHTVFSFDLPVHPQK